MLRRATLLLLAVLAVAVVAACGGDDEASSAEELQDVVWEWQGSAYSDGSEAVPDDPSRYTLEFADDGTVAILADCNTVRGQYETGEDGSLSILLGPSTLIGCPEGSLDSRFMLDLEGAAIYFFDDDGLLRIDIKFSTGTMTFAGA